MKALAIVISFLIIVGAIVAFLLADQMESVAIKVCAVILVAVSALVLVVIRKIK